MSNRPGDHVHVYCVTFKVRLKPGAPLVNLTQLISATSEAEARQRYLFEQEQFHREVGAHVSTRRRHRKTPPTRSNHRVVIDCQ